MESQPTETILNIIKHLDMKSINNLYKTNDRLKSIIKQNKTYICSEILKNKLGGYVAPKGQECKYAELADKMALQLKSKTPNDLLADAVMEGNTMKIDILLYLGADINYNHCSILRKAISFGDLVTVKYLIQKGADASFLDRHELHLLKSLGHDNIVNYIQELNEPKQAVPARRNRYKSHEQVINRS